MRPEVAWVRHLARQHRRLTEEEARSILWSVRYRQPAEELPSQSFEVATAVDQVMERRADQCWRCDARPAERGDLGLCGDCLEQLRSAP